MTAARPALALALCLGLAAAPVLGAEPYEKFYGRYEGKAVSADGSEISPRDIEVEIGPTRGGFHVDWTVVIRKPTGKVKRRHYSIRFSPSRRPGIYKSRMRRDMFGHERPLDPLAGEPFVWATIEGDTLIVHALIVTDDGGYEMQTYRRRLVPEGMELTYSRVRDGKVLRTVTGSLRRR